MQLRHLDSALVAHFQRRNGAIVLLGPRQVGKTTIVKKTFPNAQILSVENESIRSVLERYDSSAYVRLLDPNSSHIIFDEIQMLSDPGRAAKILYDHFPQHYFVFTGSSAYNIKNKTSESLAGRKIDYHLYPLTLSEYLVQTKLESKLTLSPILNINRKNAQTIKPYDHQAILEKILLYGSYPHLINHPQDNAYLANLVDSVVFKDLTELSLLENKPAALSLLKLLAHQIGSLINYADLAARLGIDQRTVKRYISLFEQNYIIFTLSPFSQNPRDEIGKMPKVYFFDTGLRNALIQDYSPLTSRTDTGSLFENFVILDLYKYNSYGNLGYQLYYWRTKSGSEIDLVLKKHNNLSGIEIKYHPRRINRAFLNRYPQASLHVISQNNYWV